MPEQRWIADWIMLATCYRGNPTVIGADRHTEPHSPAGRPGLEGARALIEEMHIRRECLCDGKTSAVQAARS